MNGLEELLLAAAELEAVAGLGPGPLRIETVART